MKNILFVLALLFSVCVRAEKIYLKTLMSGTFSWRNGKWVTDLPWEKFETGIFIIDTETLELTIKEATSNYTHTDKMVRLVDPPKKINDKGDVRYKYESLSQGYEPKKMFITIIIYGGKDKGLVDIWTEWPRSSKYKYRARII